VKLEGVHLPSVEGLPVSPVASEGGGSSSNEEAGKTRSAQPPGAGKGRDNGGDGGLGGTGKVGGDGNGGSGGGREPGIGCDVGSGIRTLSGRCWRLVRVQPRGKCLDVFLSWGPESAYDGVVPEQSNKGKKGKDQSKEVKISLYGSGKMSTTGCKSREMVVEAHAVVARLVLGLASSKGVWRANADKVQEVLRPRPCRIPVAGAWLHIMLAKCPR